MIWLFQQAQHEDVTSSQLTCCCLSFLCRVQFCLRCVCVIGVWEHKHALKVPDDKCAIK